jgi:hypothetical protein
LYVARIKEAWSGKSAFEEACSDRIGKRIHLLRPDRAHDIGRLLPLNRHHDACVGLLAHEALQLREEIVGMPTGDALQEVQSSPASTTYGLAFSQISQSLIYQCIFIDRCSNLAAFQSTPPRCVLPRAEPKSGHPFSEKIMLQQKIERDNASKEKSSRSKSES